MNTCKRFVRSSPHQYGPVNQKPNGIVFEKNSDKSVVTGKTITEKNIVKTNYHNFDSIFVIPPENRRQEDSPFVGHDLLFINRKSI